MDIKITKIKNLESGIGIFPVAGDLDISHIVAYLGKEADSILQHAIKAVDFKGALGRFVSINTGVSGLERVFLMGVGGGKQGDEEEEEKTSITVQTIENLGGKLYSYLNAQHVKEATLIVSQGLENFTPAHVSAAIASGVTLKSYRFDKYFTKQKKSDKPTLKALTIATEANTEAKKLYTQYQHIAEGVFIARDVVSEPPNILYPESYAKICKDLKDIGLKVEVLGEKEMKKLGMNSLLAVGQGSEKESQLVVMQWEGATKEKNAAPLAFVGKGVTFDTGGISIKPSAGMEDMKYDMGGSAAVVGLMKTLALRNAKVNAVGVIGLVENMPSGSATRPSDVVVSMSGQTIEILNTDAEGRLVLADALWYTQDKFKPQFMVNLATLTGAITIALGSHRAGLFSNNDELAERLFKAGEAVEEKLWRLPMGKEYDKQMDSKTADMQNISNAKGAGSITAAQFLKRFVNDTPWAHLDIAGVAWASKTKDITPEGATAFGVRLLNKLVEEYYEN